MTTATVETGTIRTKIPARLDRLPWGRFHWLIIIGLGTAWVLDGLEVTLVGTLSSRMTEHGSGIAISSAQIGLAGSIYIVGACSGALVFGQLTDRLGRKRLMMITLAVYLAATAATGGAFNPWYFYIARFFTGAGIGGEYAAINSAIDELIPARARGRVDLVINGSYWLGSLGGAAASLALLNTAWFPKDLGWRLAWGLGVILSFAVLLVRRHVPESPRWLFIHGREDEAERIVSGIEHDIEEATGQHLEEPERVLTVRQRQSIPFREIARVAYKMYPRRSLLVLALFVGQAFIYNGITFNLGTLMTTFFGVASGVVPVFTILYAAANFTGPVTLGRLFDTVGRKPMIAGTYIASAALGVVLAVIFSGGGFNRWTFIILVMATFALASAGASAAYLTASEIFPMETRALAIAFFYAVGTAVGGVSGPLLFGSFISSGNRGEVMIAFLIGSGVMFLGGATEIFWGVKAERAQLEDVAKPLTVADAEDGDGGGAEGDSRAGSGSPGSEGGPAARRAREQAAEERARAAEHRAAMYEWRAADARGDPSAGERAAVEEALAQLAELSARACDEEADAAVADAAGDEEGHARASAARARARAFREEVAALEEADPTAARRHAARAQAERERALAHEQQAEAAGAGGDDDVHAARAAMHAAWEAFHEARAAADDAEARDDREAAERARREAGALEQVALAAESRLEAAEHRSDAAEERSAQESEEERTAAEERDRAELERRRARLARVQREQQGLRRFRPGPGRLLSASPTITQAAPHPSEALDHEIDAIVRALAEHGPTSRSDLRALVGARFWGPGVFSRALTEAVGDGNVRRVGRDTYAATDSLIGRAGGDATSEAGEAR